MTQRIVTSLWFDTQAEEAAEFYCSIFPRSRIVRVAPYTEAGPREPGTTMVVEFELDGTRFVAINGGAGVTFSEAGSLPGRRGPPGGIDPHWGAPPPGGGERAGGRG